MHEKIKREAAHAMTLISMLNVSGDAVDVVAAARQALRNVLTICDAADPENSVSVGDTGPRGAVGDVDRLKKKVVADDETA